MEYLDYDCIVTALRHQEEQQQRLVAENAKLREAINGSVVLKHDNYVRLLAALAETEVQND